ncbi:hypothetical protein [Nocardia abscessus]|uniref:hypothetical protein n=1 Tax=Nocardia abscessus TaxID=120957 RepID=UPI002455513A|nr:hypothetical protein [Nocardia abscessus]
MSQPGVPQLVQRGRAAGQPRGVCLEQLGRVRRYDSRARWLPGSISATATCGLALRSVRNSGPVADRNELLVSRLYSDLDRLPRAE